MGSPRGSLSQMPEGLRPLHRRQSSPTFSPTMAPQRSVRREEVLKESRTRGWLAATSSRQVAEASLKEFRSGALPDAARLPSPSLSPDSSPTKQFSCSPRRRPRMRRALSHRNQDEFGSAVPGKCKTLVQGTPAGRIAGPVVVIDVDALPDVVDLTSPPLSDTSPQRCTADDEGVSPERSTRHQTPVSRVRAGSRARLHNVVDVDALATREPVAPRAPRFVLRSGPMDENEGPSASSPVLDGSAQSRGFRGTSQSAVTHARTATTALAVEDLCGVFDATLRLPVSNDGAGDTRLPRDRNWLGRPGRAFVDIREAATQRLLNMFDAEVLDGALLGAAGLAGPPVAVSWSNRLAKTAGITRMKRMASGRRTAAIELSRKVLDEPDRLYNTLAHELCHAAAWIVDDCAKPPHGKVFKDWALKFRQWDSKLVITTCHDYEIRYKYRYVCKGCREEYGRHSKSIDTTKKVCGRCKGRLELTKG